MKEKAFTLNELLITVAIFLIISGAIFSGYNLSQKAYRESEIAAEITQNSRVILERMNREIRQAKELVGDFPEEKADAVNEITFEDGHVADPYQYIHYFIEDSTVNREVKGFYFSGDPEQNLVPWNAIPPLGQSLETKALETPKIIGEWVSDLQLWGSGIINVALTLQENSKSFYLETKILGRNF